METELCRGQGNQVGEEQKELQLEEINIMEEMELAANLYDITILEEMECSSLPGLEMEWSSLPELEDDQELEVRRIQTLSEAIAIANK